MFRGIFYSFWMIHCLNAFMLILAIHVMIHDLLKLMTGYQCFIRFGFYWRKVQFDCHPAFWKFQCNATFTSVFWCRVSAPAPDPTCINDSICVRHIQMDLLWSGYLMFWLERQYNHSLLAFWFFEAVWFSERKEVCHIRRVEHLEQGEEKFNF